MTMKWRACERWVVAGLFAAQMAAAAPDFVWMEAEAPSGGTMPHTAGGVQQSTIASGGRVLYRKADAPIPESGETLDYAFDSPAAGTYGVWLRVGFPGQIPDVSWRVDEGPWCRVGLVDRPVKGEPDPRPRDRFQPTVNEKEAGYWNALGWWHVGDAPLTAGAHTLHLSFIPGLASTGAFAVDAIGLVRGAWTPEGKLKPGETYDGELDRQAAAHVFALPAPAADGGRTQVSLAGAWQVARYDDPDMDVDTFKPVDRLPAPDEYELRWMGIPVPSSLWDHPETALGHRAIYRTRVDVPAAHAGRGFKLHFSGTSWIVSVFVNGKLAGTHKGLWIPWDLDVSAFIEPGRVNELAVAVKGPWYAWDPAHNTWDVHRNRVRPLGAEGGKFWLAPVYPSTKGDGDGRHYGLVNPVTLASVGRAYTEDVFIRPSVERKELAVDVTVRNMSDRPRALKVVCEAVHEKSGQVARTFEPVAVTVAPGQTATAAAGGPWENPKLWWPVPGPEMYRLRTRILDGDAAVDVQEEPFGFREVTVKGTGVYINGVRRNVWCWVDPCVSHGASAEEYAAVWRAEGNRFLRFSRDNAISGVLGTREACLDFFDRQGIPGRLCSMIDGMFISFNLGSAEKPFRPNEVVWENFREHLAQLTKAYRNHPSVILYQIENELIYINGCNRLGANLDEGEREMMQVYLAGYANDPTRPYSVGGGGDLGGAAGMDRSLEINSPHYPDPSYDYYPDDAYAIEHYSTRISRWPWKRDKPWIVGESLFASELAMGSYVAGPLAYRSRDDTDRGKAAFLRMVYGGYRWAGVAGFFPWTNLAAYEDGRKIFGDLIAIPRKQSGRLYGGRENRLLYKVMNDTLSAAPVNFAWSYELGGRTVAGESVALSIEPGFGEERTLVIAPPAVDARADGVLKLRVTQEGAAPFEEDVPVPVLPAVSRLRSAVPLLAYDPSGRVASWLAAANASFEPVADLSALASGDRRGLLLVGPDALTSEQAFGSDLLKFAFRGNQVVCLEQSHPPAGANLPARLRATEHFGGYAHPQALGTPVFRDLGRRDLIDWAGDGPTYVQAYLKPEEGARSLAECGVELPYSALVEVPAGTGFIVLCQLRAGAKLGLDPAADILVRNLVEHYAGRRPSSIGAALFAPDAPLLAAKVAATGVSCETVTSLAEGLDPARYRAFLVDATAANLRGLADARARVDGFQDGGGWIVLCNVRPDSLAEFNALAGTDHILRRFRSERVVMENPDHPLAATLGHADVMQLSAKVQQASRGAIWASWDTFSACLDATLDAAPFSLPPGADDDPFASEPTWSDGDPYNWVNGMLTSDNWRYVRQIWVVKEGETDPNGKAGPAGLTHTFRLRRPERLAAVEIWNNMAYSSIENLDVVFDGDESAAVHAVLPDHNGKFVIGWPAPRDVKQTVTLRIRSWRVKPHASPLAPHLVGVDNVRFIRAAPVSRAVALDSVGGLVARPRGAGGLFVSQIQFMADEPNPKNAPRKVALLGTLLQNMGVGVRAGVEAVVPGVNVRYRAVDITANCTAYRARQPDKPYWFGKDADLSALQPGEGYFADVLFHPVDYATAPVPEVIRLIPRNEGPQEVKGIKVGARADALFFLHGADVRRPITDSERQRVLDRRDPFVPPTVANYILHYADGQTVTIPVVLGEHVDHWLQAEPRSLPGARVAWEAPAVGGSEGQRSVLYAMKAVNPRPEATIDTIDVEVGWDWVEQKGKGRVRQNQNRAEFGVVAITLGTLEK